MKKIFIFVISVLLMFQSISFASEIKPGDACTKIGAVLQVKAVSLTCKLLGKKKVWQVIPKTPIKPVKSKVIKDPQYIKLSDAFINEVSKYNDGVSLINPIKIQTDYVSTTTQPVFFISNSDSICSFENNGTLLLKNYGECSISIGQSETEKFLASLTTFTFRINKLKQSIILGDISKVYLYSVNSTYLSTISIPISTSSGLIPNIVSQTNNVCKILNSQIQLVSSGQCTIVVNAKGNAIYEEAEASQINFESKPECSIKSEPTGNGSYPTWTCYVGTRLVASPWCCSYTSGLFVYEYVGGSKIMRTNFTTSMIYRYVGGNWMKLSPVINSNYGFGQYANLNCQFSSFDPKTGITTCQEGGFEMASITRGQPGLAMYCFAGDGRLRNLDSDYCSSEFSIQWIAKNW